MIGEKNDTKLKLHSFTNNKEVKKQYIFYKKPKRRGILIDSTFSLPQPTHPIATAKCSLFFFFSQPTNIFRNQLLSTQLMRDEKLILLSTLLDRLETKICHVTKLGVNPEATPLSRRAQASLNKPSLQKEPIKIL